MHTLKIIFGGFVLLGICLFAGRWLGGATVNAIGTATKWFLGLWLIATLLNLWFP